VFKFANNSVHIGSIDEVASAIISRICQSLAQFTNQFSEDELILVRGLRQFYSIACGVINDLPSLITDSATISIQTVHKRFIFSHPSHFHVLFEQIMVSPTDSTRYDLCTQALRLMQSELPQLEKIIQIGQVL
jgi:hypothetical protein